MSNFLGGFAKGFNATGALDPFERNAMRKHESDLIKKQQDIDTMKEVKIQIDKSIEDTKASMESFINVAREQKAAGATPEQLKDLRAQIIIHGATSGFVTPQEIQRLRDEGKDDLANLAELYAKQNQMLLEKHPLAGIQQQKAQFMTQNALSQFDAIIGSTPTPQQTAEINADNKVIEKQALEDAGLNKTSLQRELEASGLEPGTPEYRKALREANMPTSISVGKAESALSVERAKNVAGREKTFIDSVDEAASAAFKANDRLTFMADSLEKIKTGALAPLKKSLGGIMEAFGFDPELVGINIDELATAQAFAGAVAEIALIKAENMKGNLSDKDLAFLQSSAPKLSNTVEGNRLIIDLMVRMNDREINKQVLMDTYLEENNGSLTGFNQEWKNHIDKNPLFNDQAAVDKALEGTLVTDKFETVINESGEEEELPVFEFINGKLQRAKQ